MRTVRRPLPLCLIVLAAVAAAALGVTSSQATAPSALVSAMQMSADGRHATVSVGAASDITFSGAAPFASDRLIVRFRIDGVLYPQAEADPKVARPLLVRLKVMSSLDIAERRLPQDGRMTVKAGSHLVDVRLSTLPAQHGEAAVMRLLDRKSIRLNSSH